LFTGPILSGCRKIKDERFRHEVMTYRKLFWQPRRHAADVGAVGGIVLKDFQSRVLDALGDYVEELKKKAATAHAAQQALCAMENMADLAREAGDFPKQAWQALNARRLLPPAFAERPHSSRFDGAGRPIPNVCLKVPTGGGKTLLAASAVARVFSAYLGRHAGLVLWIVPNEAIYRQTLKALADRDHPYRQILNVAGAGRVKILEKNSPLASLDRREQPLRDGADARLRGAAEQGDAALLPRPRQRARLPAARGRSRRALGVARSGAEPRRVCRLGGKARRRRGRRRAAWSRVRSATCMRLLRPLVVMDEGHHAYTENALAHARRLQPLLSCSNSRRRRAWPRPRAAVRTSWSTCAARISMKRR
jgi:type III restriction enzyme